MCSPGLSGAASSVAERMIPAAGNVNGIVIVSLPVPALNVPASEELRESVEELRVLLGLHSEAAAVRVAIGEACEKRGIKVPPLADLIGSRPGRPRETRKGGAKKTARKPPR